MNRGQRTIDVIGHGGAGDFFPGNSKPSIEQALKIGVDRIEFDVQCSADGSIVLVHDEHLISPDGELIAVRALTCDQLRALLPGFLTFSEAVEMIGDAAPLLVDIKYPGYERELIAAMRTHALDDSTAVSSTHASVLKNVREAFPSMRLGLSTGHLSTRFRWSSAKMAVSFGLQLLTPLPLLGAVRAVHATDVMIQYRASTRALVVLMHRNGVRVNTWTVDHPKQIKRVINLGVDGIISNRPDLVKEAVERERSAQ
jgi:glycerophosphoryl diester phosphodiesterase